MQITIAKKFYAVFIILLLIILAVSSSGIYALQETSGSYEHIISGPEVSKQYAQSAKEHFSNAAGFFTTYSITKNPDITDSFKSEIEDTVDSLAPVKKGALLKEKELIENAGTAIKGFTELFDRMVEKGKLSEEDSQLREEMQDKVNSMLYKITKLQDTEIEQSKTAASALKKKIIILLTTISLVGLAIGIFLATSIIKGIVPPIKKLSTMAEGIAHGDLTLEAEHSSSDEIGTLAEGMNKMIRSFHSMITNILTSAGNVVHTVDILQESAEESARGSQNQAGQADQIATAAEEMSQTITDIARNASVASETSSEAMVVAEKGQKIAREAVDTISKVHAATNELAAMVSKLNNRTGEIGDIVTVINDIADQINLLALNAAIEAARAGEQGRGFAVVADEVRRLAERTIKATAEISEKIGAVQSESSATAHSMAEASEEVVRATQYINNVGDSLQSIVGAVQKSRDQITHIATSVDEQSATAEEVAKNAERTSRISKELINMAEHVKTKVNGLITIADELKSSTSGFKTKS